MRYKSEVIAIIQPPPHPLFIDSPYLHFPACNKLCHRIKIHSRHSNHNPLRQAFTFQTPMTSHTTAKPSAPILIERLTSTAAVLAVIVCTTLATSCVAPATSSMSLGSISSISASSASSAANHHHHDSAYYNDVRESTAAAITAQASSAEVLRSISRAAKQHGISDWEVEQDSYIALGEGLRQAGLNARQAQTWAARLSTDSEQSTRLILQGYRA